MFPKRRFLNAIRVILLLAVWRSISPAQNPPTTPEELISRYQAALGGTQNFSAIASLIEKGEISGDLTRSPVRYEAPSLRKDHGSYEFYFKAPNLHMSVTIIGGHLLGSRGCDGKVAWYANPYQGVEEIKQKAGELSDCETGYSPVPWLLREPNAHLRLKGTKKLGGGRLAYVLHAEDSKLQRNETYYFDTESFLLVRSDSGSWLANAREYSDYRDVGGIKIPFVVTQETENSRISTTLRQVQINVPIPDRQFEKPSSRGQRTDPASASKSTAVSGLNSSPPDNQLKTRIARLELPEVSAPTAPAESGSGHAAPAHSPESIVYVNATNFSSCPLQELLQDVPELHGLEVGPNEKLSTLLDRIGQTLVDLSRKTPNLISHEEVWESQPGSKVTRRHFSYLILSHPGQDAVTLEEYRMSPNDATQRNSLDMEAQTSGGNVSTESWSSLRLESQQASEREPGSLPLSQGFANMWINFYPSNRSQSTFRYLGRQKIDGHRTLVLTFAQTPSFVRMPGVVQFKDKKIALFFQGVAWVDESDFRIVRLRTDLLSPPVDAPLHELTAKIRFAETPVTGVATPLWLPREVEVTSELAGLTFGDKHFYSGYRLFGVQTKIRLDP